MIITKSVPVKITKRNIDWYLGRGYREINRLDIVSVNVNDLHRGANILIDIACDYCGKTIQRLYCEYFRKKQNCIIKADCCIDCRHRKSQEVLWERYGEDAAKNDGMLAANSFDQISPRGVINPMFLPSTAIKMRNTMVNRYGVENAMQSVTSREKCKQTCLERYGTENPMSSAIIQEKTKNTNLKKYGVEYYTQTAECKEKIRNSLYKNRNVPTSKQQQYIYDFLLKSGYDVTLNFPEGAFNLDVALFADGEKIDIEYDGWYWHQDIRKDVVRSNVLIKKGWKVVRFLGGSSFPGENLILDSISKAMKENQKLQLLKLNDWKN